MRLLRFIGYILGGITLIALIVILSLPTIVSTPWGKDLVVGIANQYLDGKVKVDSLQLSWFGHQKIEGFSLADDKEIQLLNFNRLSTQASLWQILNKRTDIGHIELDNLNTNIVTPHNKVSLSDVYLKADVFTPGKPLTIIAKGKSTDETISGYFDITAILPITDVKNWSQANEELRKLMTAEKSNEATLYGVVSNFPVALFDELCSMPLTQIIGDRLNVQLNKDANAKEFLFTLQVSSPNLEGNLKGKIENNTLLLQNPASLRWTVSPLLFQQIADQLEDASHPFIVTLNVDKIIIPLQRESDSKIDFQAYFPVPLKDKTFGKEAQVEVSINHKPSHDALVEAKIQTDKITISPIQLSLDSKKATAHITVPSSQTLFGSSAQINVEAFRDEPITFKTDIKSDKLRMNLEGELSENRDLDFTTPIEIDYQLTEELFQEFNSPIHLKQPSWVHFEINPFSINLRDINFEKFVMKGKMLVKEFAIRDQTFESNTSINNIITYWEINGSLNQIRLECTGEISLPEKGKKSNVSTKIIVHDWVTQNKPDLNRSKIEIFSNIYGIPVCVLNSYICEQNLLPVVGSLVDLQIKSYYDLTGEKPGFCDLDIDTEQFHTTARVRLEDDEITYQPGKIGLELRWTLSPEGFQSLKNLFPEIINKNTSLSEPVILSGVIPDFSIPKDNPWATLVEGHFTTNAMILKEPGQPALEPLFLTFEIESEKLNEKANITVNVLTKEKPNLLVVNAELKNLSDLNISCNVNNLPTKWAKTFLFFDPSFQKTIDTILGNQIKVHFDCQLNKTQANINGNYEGSNSSATFGAKHKDGIITLTKPLIFEMPLSPRIADKDAPILSQISGSDHPMRITIEPQDFRLPVAPFDMNGVKISKGVVELGKLYFRNQGEIKNLLSLLKPIPGDNVSIWFTPIYFDISKGQMNLKRLDMLIGQYYTLAAWGNIELATKNMDVNLGLSEQALRYAFGIQGLDKNYMLRVPVTGQQGKISVDYSRTAARISALVVQTQESLHAKLLGTLLEIASGDGSGRPPSPTTQPFPWSNEFTDGAGNTDNHNGKKPKKPKDAPEVLIEEIGKGASSLLNQLLR